jgi:hypothetical protein
MEDLDLDRALLRLDHRNDVAAFESVARLLQPLDELAVVHVGAERGHAELAHARITRRTADTIPSTCGVAASSRCRG